MSFPIWVYEAAGDTAFRMRGQKNSNREIRARIAAACLEFPKTPGLTTMRAEKGSQEYYPVVFASASGFMGLGGSNRCVLGVSKAGVGVSQYVAKFDDFLIGFSDFNPHIIENVLRRALQGDPMSFEEWAQQRGQAGTQIVNYGNDNTIGGRDASKW